MGRHRTPSVITSPALGEALRTKSRSRRAALSQQASLQPDPARLRNDLLPGLELVERAVVDLKAPTRNVRPPAPAHVREIAASIAAFGFSAPLLVDRDGRVLDGWARVEAAGSLACLVCRASWWAISRPRSARHSGLP